MPSPWNEPGRAPAIMGILNVTPDSFSDGGRFYSVDEALSHARKMVSEGAQLIDIGGESTRPGALRQPAATQMQRVLPVIRALRLGLEAETVISVDTTSAEVARAALDAGADMINDVSAGRESPDMLALAAERRVPIVLMHMQGQPETMQDDPRYDDVVAEVRDFLAGRALAALDAGIDRCNIVLDPGIGFGKRRQDNIALLAALPTLVDLGYPLLLGTSRKRFMGSLCATRQPRDLLGATCATSALAAISGVSIVRVHDVEANRQAAEVAWVIAQAGANRPARFDEVRPRG
ncbi:MAG: dihydropteroate synthase [Gammaproteobacteria bacterium]|nr:dihydropteroate synthase [Gammaproteobacteria bacterium]